MTVASVGAAGDVFCKWQNEEGDVAEYAFASAMLMAVPLAPGPDADGEQQASRGFGGRASE